MPSASPERNSSFDHQPVGDIELQGVLDSYRSNEQSEQLPVSAFGGATINAAGERLPPSSERFLTDAEAHQTIPRLIMAMRAQKLSGINPAYSPAQAPTAPTDQPLASVSQLPVVANNRETKKPNSEYHVPTSRAA